MITAKEARDVIRQGNYMYAIRQMKSIERKINSAIDYGLYRVTIDESILPVNKQKLIDMGYSVDSGVQNNSSVSWQ